MRINVNLSDEMNKRLDNYSKRYGMSKSSIVGFVVGQWLDGLDSANKTLYGDDSTKGLVKEVLSDMLKDYNAK